MNILDDNPPKQPYHPPTCPQCHSPTQPSRPFCARCRFDLRYGTPRPITSGQCIYCQDRCRFSEEHIFPRWLGNYFPRRHKQTLHQFSRPERHVFWDKVTLHGEDFRERGDPYTITVRNVCESCNNGWMSKLQAEAKPLVYALASGENKRFDQSERFILARWSAMVSINLECYARMLRAKQFQRTTLMNGMMPPGWQVSFARMADAACAGESFHRAVAVPIAMSSEGDYLELGSTYYVIERVVFHTLRALGDQTLRAGLMAIGLSETSFLDTEIWPNYVLDSDHLPRDLMGQDLAKIQRHFE